MDIRIGSHSYERDHRVRASWIASLWTNLPMIPRNFQPTDPLNGSRKNLSDTQLTERRGPLIGIWSHLIFDGMMQNPTLIWRIMGCWEYSNLLTLNHQPTNYTWNQLIRRIRFSHSNSNKKDGKHGKNFIVLFTSSLPAVAALLVVS